MLCGLTGSAANPGLRIDQLYHSGWTVKDGAPGDVHALAQTSDGFLWLGTSSGLYRFDGIRFEHYEPQSGGPFPRNNVDSLLAIPEGGLWIGYRLGGASFLRAGRLTNFGEQDGLPTSSRGQFARDGQGTVWKALGVGGLARFQGSRWEVAGLDWNFSGSAYAVFVDRKGTLWVGTADSVVFLPFGAHRFQVAVDRLHEVEGFAEARNGAIWMAETLRSVRPIPLPWIDARLRPAEVKVGSIAAVFDDQGSLWITTIGEGIRRVTHPEQLNGIQIKAFGTDAEIFRQNNGLTGDYAECILEDREGDIWVGTKMGLDRFRRGVLSPLSFPRGSSDFTMVAGNDGTVWAAARNRRVIMRIQDGKIVDKKQSEFVECAYRDPDGPIWIGELPESPAMLGTISRLHDVRSNRIKVPGEYVQAITKDSSGRLWVSVPRKGVFRLEDGKWTSLESLGGPRTTAPSEFTDSEGRVWFGFLNDTVAMLDGDRLRTYSAKDGVLVGNVMTIHGHGTNVWIGGDLGIERFDGAHFRPIIAADGKAFGAVYGIVETANGLWFTENRGIAHISEAELKLMLQDPGYRPSFTILDVLDGLPAQLQRAQQVPTVIESTDGLLWFSTIQGLAWLDPNHIPRNAVPPPVSVLSIIAAGKKYFSSLPTTLPARTTSVEIVYTALSLSIPERVRFRYMLEGQDSTWQEAGTRREAFYTNLGPGSYRFRVVACNNDGVWNETGAALSFVIAPAIYQALWFRLLYAAAGVGVLWVFFFIRMRQVTLQVKTRLEERVEERERIARELHDTLLQGFQGLILRFQAITNRIPKEDTTHNMMEQALEHADEVLLEGRERVRNLRSEETAIEGLSEALTSCANELSADHRADISVSVVGTPQVLHTVVRDEAFRVGREALANALKHSNALRIEAEIIYDSSGMRLRVRDNGDGIDETILTDGRPGHWGLSGMRERAKKIGARLNLLSRLGAGTEVELIVPASIAYSTGVARSRWYWITRVIGGGR